MEGKERNEILVVSNKDLKNPEKFAKRVCKEMQKKDIELFHLILGGEAVEVRKGVAEKALEAFLRREFGKVAVVSVKAKRVTRKPRI